MNDWHELLVDNKSIMAIYKEDIPSLKGIDVHSLTLHRDGAKLSLRFNLKEYPSLPPKKWHDQGFNTVQIVLSLLELKSINISGWVDNVYIANIDIESENGMIKFSVFSEHLNIVAEAVFLDLESITAYSKNLD